MINAEIYDPLKFKKLHLLKFVPHRAFCYHCYQYNYMIWHARHCLLCTFSDEIVCLLSDEIDIIGYGSGTSDDDHSSVESGSSDGFTISAKRIRLNSSYSESLWNGTGKRG